MQQEKINLRSQRDFGMIIEDYFLFIKQNLKPLFNLFIKYNGLLLIMVFISSYLFVSGVLDLILQSQYGGDNSFGSGGVMFFTSIAFFILLLMFLSMFNYGLGASYMTLYEKNGPGNFTDKQVFAHFTKNIPKTLMVIIMAIILYVFMIIISVIFAFIPIIGTLAYYVIALGYSAWIGLTFMSAYYENHGVIESYTEAWSLLMSKFWKAVGVNLVVGLFLSMIMFMIAFVPGLLVGIYTAHSVQTNVDIADSFFNKALLVIAVSAFVGLLSFWQLLSQLINGFLYFNLHEGKFLTHTRNKINSIGLNE